ncbi:MAG: L,D-transpeptidase family protein [Pirellula sp.]
MQTIKTAVVVVLLLFVLYGGYVALNGENTELQTSLENLVSPDELVADVSGPAGFQPTAGSTSNAPNADPFAKFASTPLPTFSPPSPPPIASPAVSTTPSAGIDNSAELASPPTIPAIPSSGPPTIPSLPNLSSSSSTLPMLAPSLRGNDSAPRSTEATAKTEAPGTSAVDKEQGSKEAPGFGLAVPSAPSLPTNNSLSNSATNSSNELGLLPKTINGSNPPAIPPLDLPTLHGGADNLKDATTERNSEPSTISEPSIPSTVMGKSYENAKQLAMDQADEGKLREALATLSVFYNAAELTTDQRNDLLDMLDALAREVIYSQRHLMELPYVIAPNETLEQVAKRYKVPKDILARINGLDPESEPAAGAKLKIVQGPFRAEIDLTRNELTLFADDLYAGRYPATFGAEPLPKPGLYQVLDKQRKRNYYSSNGVQISSDDPKNPYGGYWIDLGQDLCIHGSAELDVGTNNLGCISLSPLDAIDVFGMLGRGSQVTIRK